MSDPIRLNLGCANRPLVGFVNLDMQWIAGVDVVHRIDPFHPTIPYGDNTIIEIFANNFVEHIADTIGLITEMWRVSVDGAKWFILTPGYRDINSWRDPGHLSHWEERNLDFFTEEGFDGRHYGQVRLSYTLIGDNNHGLEFHVVAHKKTGGA